MYPVEPDNITRTKPSTTKPCAYSMEYIFYRIYSTFQRWIRFYYMPQQRHSLVCCLHILLTHIESLIWQGVTLETTERCSGDFHSVSWFWLYSTSWWHHQTETFFVLLALCAGNSPVNGEFPTQRPVTRSFDIFFDLSLNKQFSKQPWGWWFETPSWSLWHHCNVMIIMCMVYSLLRFVQFKLYLPLSFRVASLALGQSFDCPSVCEVILKKTGKWTTWMQ